MKLFQRLPVELFVWISALFLLATATPVATAEAVHGSLCPLATLGFSWCPGCGLGRSITLLFHGDLAASFRMHWLGVPAVLILGNRILTLSKMEWAKYKRILKEKEGYYV